jgi:UDP-GlcNAc:undecaprenyl-phosphate GlcNAc-1-phosphate transferase
MRTAATAFLAAIVAGAVLTPLVRHLAHRFGALDHALTSRKLHGKPIPRLGGIAIVLAFYAPLVALFFANSEVGRRFYADPHKAAGLIAGGLAIAALGVYDDLRGANAKKKFLVQFAVAGFMYWAGFRIDHVANPFGPPIDLGWLGLPFTLLWVAGVINAMNLIDGLDGLAGGVALIAIATTFAFSVTRGEPLMVLFTAALAGSVLGFLFYNFNPASIFMGDTGSMFLGFVLATTAIQTNQKSSTAVAIVVPIIALGVPIADTLLAMARRAARGVPMFSADRGHIHHRLLAQGFTHRQTVLVLYGTSVVLGGVALAFSFANASQATLVLLALSGFGYLFLRRLGFFSVAQVQRVLEDRRKNLGVRREIRRIGETLREARSVEDAWVAVRMGGRALGAVAVALHLPEDAPGDPLARSDGFDDAGPGLLRARYGLFPERPGDTHVELGWADGRGTVDRDTEIAIELFCDHLSLALERIDRAREAAEGPLAPVVNLRR